MALDPLTAALFVRSLILRTEQARSKKTDWKRTFAWVVFGALAAGTAGWALTSLFGAVGRLLGGRKPTSKTFERAYRAAAWLKRLPGVLRTPGGLEAVRAIRKAAEAGMKAGVGKGAQ